MLQFVIYPIFLGACAMIIFWWIHGMRKRCFNKAYARNPQPCWTIEDQPFLEYIEKSYLLPKGFATRLPETETPMGLYLTLYPEHCIYDANENLKFLRSYYQGQEIPQHSALLTESFRTLAKKWQALQKERNEK